MADLVDELKATDKTSEQKIKMMEDSPFVSGSAKKHMQKLMNEVGADGRREHRTVRELEEFVSTMQKSIPQHASLNVEFANLAGLPRAGEAFSGVTLQATSKNADAVAISGLLSTKDFAAMTLQQKRSYIQALRTHMEEVGETNESAFAAVLELKKKLVADERVPDSWKAWLEKPEPYTLAYAVNWVDDALPELTTQTKNYTSLATKVRGNPAAARALQEKGIRMHSTEEFQKMNREDRNSTLTAACRGSF